MIPEFEEKVVEERDRTRIVQDWKGNVCEIGKQFSVKHLRNAIDFVTRRWIRCPVENRQDWEKMKARYDPDHPDRLPENAEALGRRLKERTWVVELTFPGPFWQMREWLGFERLCTSFYDDPGMIEDMVLFWQHYIARLLRRVFACMIPDSIRLGEDMAYKAHAMISPEMVRRYLLPCYAFWGEIIRNAGCPLYSMDSDGYIAELIPIWLEAGINVCDPMEVAAGNDILRFREMFGRRMAYRGGVDKRAMAKGGRILADEIGRVRPAIEDGGYIPGCDHGVPFDVSWQNYVETVRLLAEATGWL
jgi:uroporphyrinogen decarboxylase